MQAELSRRLDVRSALVALVAAIALVVGLGPPRAAAAVTFPIAARVSLDVQLMPSASGLYVVVPDWNHSPSRTLVAALDGGRLRSGWPIELNGSCRLVPSDVDASVRVLCGTRAFAYGRDGRSLPGWPVVIGGSASRLAGAAVMAGNLVALIDNGDTMRLVRVSSTGRVRAGTRLTTRFGALPGCSGCVSDRGPMGVAPDGTGYAVTYTVQFDPWGGVTRTTVTTFDLNGVRAGWPIRLDGAASAPVFGPDGRIYLTRGITEAAPTRLVVVDRTGHVIPGVGGRLPIVLPTYGGYGEGPGFEVIPPMVASDGSATVLPIQGSGIAVYRTDRSGSFRSAWTYRSTAEAQEVWQFRCDTPSWADPTRPALAPDGTAYVLRGGTATSGVSAIAIDATGKVKKGWPVMLRRAGAEFWSVAAGPDGTAYLLAVEPEARSADECEPYAAYSATVLTVAPDGTVQHRTTVIEP